MLFEPYRLGVDAGPREAGGVGGHGLGLAVVAQTASAHGGSVEAQNRGGGGAAFRITLPCDRRGAA
jgi:signal transduction histidine kinase